MYNVIPKAQTSYGAIVSIERDEDGIVKTPFLAIQLVCKEARLLREAGATKVRFFIDDKIMTLKQAEQWADEEYKSLPKCSYCAKLMEEDVFTHQLCSNLFCSQICSDKDYTEITDKQNDEYECDFI